MKALWLLGLIAYILIDHLLTVGCFGFYHPYLYFSSDVFRSKFLLGDYSFITSPLDFEFLALIRSLALLAGLTYMWTKRRVTRLPGIRHMQYIGDTGENIGLLGHSRAALLLRRVAQHSVEYSLLHSLLPSMEERAHKSYCCRLGTILRDFG